MSEIAISNLAWHKCEDEHVFQLMAKAGISNLEISPFRESANKTTLNRKSGLAIKKQLNQYGIQIIAIQSLLYRFPDLMLFSNEKLREKTFKHLIKIIDFANIIGANTLVFGSPKNKIRGNLKYNEAFEIATYFFKRLASQLQKYKINFCIEPTPAIYEADFIRNIDEAVSLIKAVDSSVIKLNLDLGASIINNEDVTKLLRINSKYIGHIHISEPFLKTINFNYSLHRKIAQAIRNSSYNGIVSIEMLPADTKNIQAIQNTLSFVNEVYS